MDPCGERSAPAEWLFTVRNRRRSRPQYVPLICNGRRRSMQVMIVIASWRSPSPSFWNTAQLHLSVLKVEHTFHHFADRWIVNHYQGNLKWPPWRLSTGEEIGSDTPTAAWSVTSLLLVMNTTRHLMSPIKNYYVILGCDSYIMIVLDSWKLRLAILGARSILRQRFVVADAAPTRHEAQNEKELYFRWPKSRSNYSRRRQIPRLWAYVTRHT